MWGCIGIIKTGAKMNPVPSLYVRVYRFATHTAATKTSSLIICEGVSVSADELAALDEFPHYMWGCIGFLPPACMPSVRSLIICEGVSSSDRIKPLQKWFPHYMWGCIVILQIGKAGDTVPSLYVRVYHVYPGNLKNKKRSLIICEGVSGDRIQKKMCPPFPHYMWGCIAELCSNPRDR